MLRRLWGHIIGRTTTGAVIVVGLTLLIVWVLQRLGYEAQVAVAAKIGMVCAVALMFYRRWRDDARDDA